jgi:branched-chain amino acid transport system ATP-binding protein
VTAPLLAVEGLGVRYGQAVAVYGATLSAPRGVWVCLVGPNGAGKTSFVRAILGLTPYSGRVAFNGQRLDDLPTWERQRLGIGYVPEGRQLFPQLTVEENLRMGGHTLLAERLREGLEQSYAMFPRLRERRGQLAGTLSGGEQQMLALARGLICRPALLIVDEISWGVMPVLAAQIFVRLQELNREGLAILQVEQNARDVLRRADHAYVMSAGRIVVDGPAERIAQDNRVLESYIG